MKKKVLIIGSMVILVVIILTLVIGGMQRKPQGSIQGPEDVVPSYEVLVQNLTNEGYEIHEETNALDCDVTAKRVIATKGKKYIDICYELEEEDVDAVFKKYQEKYENTSFYVLAQNGNFVYCVSDKKTFKKSGFTSLANYGQQILR